MYVYARPGFEGGEFAEHPSVKIFQTPQMDISSTFIRKSIMEGKDMRYMLPVKFGNIFRKCTFMNSVSKKTSLIVNFGLSWTTNSESHIQTVVFTLPIAIY